MSGLRQDFVYSARRLMRSPGLVLAVVVSIGLGVAANATIFSMVSRFVLQPPPVGDPGTLLALHTTHDGDQCCNNFSWPVYIDVRDQAKSFSGVAAYYELLPASIGGSGEPERVWGQSATENYFRVARVPMALGRGFATGEEKQSVIVLGYRLWTRRFGADPAIVGKAITLSGKPFTVVGVAGPGFHGLDLILDPEFWIPLGNVEQFAPNVPDRKLRDDHWLGVVARLRPGATREQANAELKTLAVNYAAAYPATDKGNGFLTGQAGSLPPRDRETVLLFLGALSVVVLLVLGIACANVSNLLLAYAATRQREMAIRLSLGARRAQLLRQMLVESTLLALGGGVAGAPLAWWGTSALGAFHVPAPVPLDLRLSLDWRVLLYTVALSVGAGLLFGMLPAWIASRPMMAGALRGEDALARPGRRVTLRSVLVVAQIAMSMVLLCVTGLFLRSLERATGIDIGFRSRGVLMVSVDPRVQGYTPEQTNRFLGELREEVAAVPGVLSVAETDSAPLSGGNRSDGFVVEGRKSRTEAPIVEEYMATAGYFETLRIPRIAGRDFARESATGPKVAIVNEALARQLFGSDNPIGQRVTGGGATYEIIGVAGNIKSRTLGEETRPVLFRSLDQNTGSDPSFLGYTLMVRTTGDMGATASAVRQVIRGLDAGMAVYNVETMEEHLRSALFLPRLAGTLFGVFGSMGLVLAAVGLYGVMSYSVSRRRREIGIRIALGAQLGAVQRLIVRQGLLLTVTALALGVAAAWFAARFCASFLYGMSVHDPLTFALAPLFLASVALLACWIPARRAARIEPQSALRSE
ncbi:MAG TPA: ABC transporter permease [Acidobacteriaceae bacterium]|jgi:predicted permease|nr:ABC transporter permease [Acidobacteriaceae bacterium]